MDKKSREPLRRFKNSRDSSSSDSSSSGSDSSSDSSSDSNSKQIYRKRKGGRPNSSSSEDERKRKRDKNHVQHQKKLEAKRNMLKKKLKESGKRQVSPSMRRRVTPPPSSHKIRKAIEHHPTKHPINRERSQQEREREREKLHRMRGRSSRSPKGARHGRKSPIPNRHHQISPREKIIIQTRRDRSPKMRHDSRERERRERERSRDRERAEALARCQERQKERERIAREKTRREREDKLRMGSREKRFDSRERSIPGQRPYDNDIVDMERQRYDRECSREFNMRRLGSPAQENLYRERDIFPSEERGNMYHHSRGVGYEEDLRIRGDRKWDAEIDHRRDFDREKIYHQPASIGVGRDDWHGEGSWQGRNKKLHPQNDIIDWDADEHATSIESGRAILPQTHTRRWQQPSGWRSPQQNAGNSFKPALLPTPSEFLPQRHGFRQHPSPLPGSGGSFRQHFPSKRHMTYTNPNILKNRAAAAAAAAAVSKSTPEPILPTDESCTSGDKEEGQIEVDEKAPANTIDEEAVTEPVPDNLSEISDGEDDILANDPSELQTIGSIVDGENLMTEVETKEAASDEEELDFEEISDVELEEDHRSKGVGDALGVDWASLVEASKAKVKIEEDQHSLKQKWEPHRIILDIGISVKYAGEEFSRKLLNEVESNSEVDANVKVLHPLACVQVSQRQKIDDRKQMIFSACGANSRALSARQDLQLRRKLCNLPGTEIDFPVRPVSDVMKSLALTAFKKSIAIRG